MEWKSNAMFSYSKCILLKGTFNYDSSILSSPLKGWEALIIILDLFCQYTIYALNWRHSLQLHLFPAIKVWEPLNIMSGLFC